MSTPNISTTLLDTRYARSHFVFTQTEIGGVGDGSTDNTAAWNRAMALLEVAGGTLEFPVGVYCVSGTTQLVPGGSLLVGQGLNFGAPVGNTDGSIPARSAVIRATATMARVIQLGRNPTSSAQTDTGASMRDLVVDGQDLASDVVRTAGRRNYIYNCQIYWGASSGVNFLGQNSYFIGGVVAQNGKGNGILVGAYYDHKIFDCQIRQTGTSGSCINVNVGDVMIRGNHIYVGGTTGDANITVGSAAYNVGIYTNIIEIVNGPEIKINGGANAVNIVGNQFFNGTNAADSTYEVIRFAGSGVMNDVNITGNMVRGLSSSYRYLAFLNFAGTFTSTDRIVVSGNSGVNVAALSVGTPVTSPDYGQNSFYNGSATIRTQASGVATFSGDGSAKVFTITHGLASAPGGYTVTPASAGGAAAYYVTSSSTTLSVTYVTAPASGTGNVVLSWQATVNGSVSTTSVDTTAPSTPGTPTATGGAGQIALTWTASSDNVGVTAYHVYRSDNPTAVLGTTSSTTYTDATPTTGTAYTYTVDAADAAGNVSSKSSASNSATATASSGFVTDTFAGTNGTVLTGHTPDTGASWAKNSTASSGEGVLDSGRLRSSSASTVLFVNTTTPPAADYTVEADLVVITLLANSFAGIAIRAQTSASTYYSFRYSVSAGTYGLIKQVNGTATSLATASTAAPVAGETHRLRLTVSGTTVTAYIDGNQVASVTDSGVTAAGGAAILLGGAAATTTTGLHLDNYSAHV